MRGSNKTICSRSPHFQDRKSTRLNSSHTVISYAVFCLQKNKFVSFGENHFSNYRYTPNPLMLAVGLGRRTERLNISTGLALVPSSEPIRDDDVAATAER